MANENSANWHLKKEFSIGHIVSTILLIAMILGGWVNIQKRMVAFEAHIISPSHFETERRLDAVEVGLSRVIIVDSSLQIRIEDIQKEIIRRLDRQDIKLDRIEDRLNLKSGKE